MLLAAFAARKPWRARARSHARKLPFGRAASPYRDQEFHRKRPGIKHLAFWAESTDQVESITQELRNRGIRLLYEDRNAEQIGAPSPYSVFFEDPDRIKVEIVTKEKG